MKLSQMNLAAFNTLTNIESQRPHLYTKTKLTAKSKNNKKFNVKVLKVLEIKIQ